MSFRFEWPSFSASFYDQAKELLCSALNKGDKPPIIADRIHVHHLDMGSIPPDLEILEIGDLGTDRFRGIFRLTYAGDASIGLQTKIQANPLRQKPSATSPDILSSPSILFASTPLVVPMTLKLSCLRLKAIVVLVISRLEGVTLVFKNDPLESVEVSSTFDSVSAIQAFVQSEIERQLRELFRTELPGIIHNLSRRWIKSRSSDALPQPSSSNVPPPPPSSSHPSAISPNPSCLSDSRGLASEPVPLPGSVPDCVESYDPTYGLRPSHPPLVGQFTRYRSLVAKKARTQGLSAVLESESESESNTPSSPPPSHRTSSSPIRSPTTPDQTSNRGTLKPRILRSPSALMSPCLITTPGSSSVAASSLAFDSRSTRRVFSGESHLTNQFNDKEHAILRHFRLERFSTSSFSPTYSRSESIHMTSTTNTTPTTSRKSFVSQTSSPISSYPLQSSNSLPIIPPTTYWSSSSEEEEELNHCHLLASLNKTNWTLSPFTRSIDHVVARSTPPPPPPTIRSMEILRKKKDIEINNSFEIGCQKRVTKVGKKKE
ncbi:hypothetical protein CROQUDRAFT_723054 [Cronartium quercuum f. sp. fusiforme G11]|uniref:Mitochondrial distribution and morphology protein 34 n=1 Tax=Cronartium quercuum f. sp. fusiforme G11 TaxID=708437 RepID=A0A9P6NID6_9BASI|nr:hypothetical protein CROQUDRAFT_723054 [Cronartium quercuum f. sp. fusiforme G11]